MTRPSFLVACTMLIWFTVPQIGFAGTWQVIPIRLEFDQRTRSGVVTIANDSEERISFSIEARAWIQDEEGKDQYEDTSDLLFFPKALSIDPHAERVIRVGVKIPAVKNEKTYRLFIKQEVPPEERSGTTVAIAIRFGVPIFSKPVAEEIRGAVTRQSVEKGILKFGLKNSGNSHFRLAKIHLFGNASSGLPIYSHDLEGGYILAGTERIFEAALPADVCTELHEIEIVAKSPRIQLNGKIDVDTAMCLDH